MGPRSSAHDLRTTWTPPGLGYDPGHVPGTTWARPGPGHDVGTTWHDLRTTGATSWTLPGYDLGTARHGAAGRQARAVGACGGHSLTPPLPETMGLRPLAPHQGSAPDPAPQSPERLASGTVRPTARPVGQPPESRPRPAGAETDTGRTQPLRRLGNGAGGGARRGPRGGARGGSRRGATQRGREPQPVQGRGSRAPDRDLAQPQRSVGAQALAGHRGATPAGHGATAPEERGRGQGPAEGPGAEPRLGRARGATQQVREQQPVQGRGVEPRQGLGARHSGAWRHKP